jgi:LDH2 family malate/lactate/ureidoglycolate dehydrogenase
VTGTDAPAGAVRIGRSSAREFAAALLVAEGASEASAAIVATHLVESDLCGVHSHGLLRVPQYLEELANGEIDGCAEPSVSRRGDAFCVVDGNRAFGQVAALEAVEHATADASAHGLGLATVVRAGHAGRIGSYVEQVAAAGTIGLAFCSGPRSGHRVAPFGGIDGRLATNPIAFALPGDGSPVVGDFSTSSVPEGVVRRLRELGQDAPEGSLQDADGSATKDPGSLYAEPRGTIRPLGGDRFGHKGYALGLMVEAMTTVLAGEDASDPERFGNNLTLLVVAGDDRVATAGARLAGYVRSARAADPARPVLLPGDLEHRARERGDDVELDPPVWRALAAAAERLSVPIPAVAS